MRATARNYMALVRDTVNRMALPSWYTREEGYSAGYFALVQKLGQYEVKRRKGMQCNVRTYVRNLTRYAVKREVAWYVKEWRQRRQLEETDGWQLID